MFEFKTLISKLPRLPNRLATSASRRAEFRPPTCPFSVSDLWAHGKSTTWPSFSRFAVYYAALVFLTSLIYFGLGIYVAVLLWKMPEYYSCWSEHGKGHEYRALPLTFRDEWIVDPVTPFSVDYPPKATAIAIGCIIVPIFACSVASMNTISHFKRNLTNRGGFIDATFAAGIWLTFPQFDHMTTVDSGQPVDFDYCITPLTSHLASQRRHRIIVMTARAWLEAIACILLAIYLMTSIQAAYLNNKIAARNHNRVTDLHGEMELGDLLSRSRVDNPSTASGTAGTTDAMDTSSNTRDITRPERAMVSYDRRAEAGEERPYKNPFTGPQQ